MSKFDFSVDRLDDKLKALKSKNTNISLLRIVVFFGLIGTGVLFLSEHAVWGLVLAFLAWAFVRLINVYNFHKDQEAIYLGLRKLNDEIQAQKLRQLQDLDPGVEFLDKKHPFANDLDLFGEHSLFQLINHTVSEEGKGKLAEQLKSDFDLEEAAKKREAIDELAQKNDFLAAMGSIGKAFYKEGNPSGWQGWLGTEEKIKSWIWPFAILGPVGGLGLSVAVYLGFLPASFLGIWILLGLGFLGAVFSALKKAGDEIPSREELKTYRYWMEVLDGQTFQSETLRAAIEPLQVESEKAYKLLAQLDSFGLWVQNRINILYIPVNLLFWTDLLLYLRLIAWKNRFGKQLASFPDALSSWEVWYSLGIFQSELGAQGEVSAVEKGISGTAISHPLLSPEVAIPNDFLQSKDDQVILLTGANMSGKTTFMRTLGVNCVLTNLGLRPFAKAFGFANFQLYTSMRNSDNLGESVSSFYAELSRIKQLIDRAEKGEEIFFLLDEILKGTNTEDRIAGSEALIRQVLETEAMGIISTHDIELAELEKRIPAVRNYSFHSEVLDQTINFDYKIKNGPCPSFNAHKLMELMGIRFRG
ncbi:DNA mismatch repair protein [Algoriphagus namhaensis]|uniref:DNA mismatch repair protein n=1 Tax=Algoriphagus namhaensis TaxID=915353 RepID=A0ABV8AR29_9BACT